MKEQPTSTATVQQMMLGLRKYEVQKRCNALIDALRARGAEGESADAVINAAALDDSVKRELHKLRQARNRIGHEGEHNITPLSEEEVAEAERRASWLEHALHLGEDAPAPEPPPAPPVPGQPPSATSAPRPAAAPPPPPPVFPPRPPAARAAVDARVPLAWRAPDEAERERRWNRHQKPAPTPVAPVSLTRERPEVVSGGVSGQAVTRYANAVKPGTPAAPPMGCGAWLVLALAALIVGGLAVLVVRFFLNGGSI